MVLPHSCPWVVAGKLADMAVDIEAVEPDTVVVELDTVVEEQVTDTEVVALGQVLGQVLELVQEQTLERAQQLD